MRLLLLLLLCLPVAQATAQQPTLSVLGTIHLHNPGNDAVNADVGNILSPSRQAELREVIERVNQNFRPTKIAFEWVAGDTLWSKHYYRAWTEGRLEEVIDPEDRYYLTSEIVQLAYPIAKAAGLTELHPIDYHNAFPLDSALNWAAENGQTDEIATVQTFFAKAQGVMDSVSTLPVPEILAMCNSDYFNLSLNQRLYLDMVTALGTGDNYCGSHVVEQWYTRNIRIFTNLSRVVEDGDRVLVIYGAGHKETLDDLIRDREDWRWVRGADLLKR